MTTYAKEMELTFKELSKKRNLLRLIEDRGICSFSNSTLCANCNIYGMCMAFHDQRVQTRYERAVKYYIGMFGTDRELLEVLV